MVKCQKYTIHIKTHYGFGMQLVLEFLSFKLFYVIKLEIFIFYLNDNNENYST